MSGRRGLRKAPTKVTGSVNQTAFHLKGRYIFSTDNENFITAEGVKYTVQQLADAGVTLQEYARSRYRITYRVR